MKTDEIKKGMIVYYGARAGRVLHRQGALAVKVLTERTRSFQDFTTGKVTTHTGPSEESWGIKHLSATAPVN